MVKQRRITGTLKKVDVVRVLDALWREAYADLDNGKIDNAESFARRTSSIRAAKRLGLYYEFITFDSTSGTFNPKLRQLRLLDEHNTH